MSRPLSRCPRRRRVLLAAALGIGLVGQPLMPPTAKAADNLVFVTGAFRRSIAVDDLAHLAYEEIRHPLERQTLPVEVLPWDMPLPLAHPQEPFAGGEVSA